MREVMKFKNFGDSRVENKLKTISSSCRQID